MAQYVQLVLFVHTYFAFVFSDRADGEINPTIHFLEKEMLLTDLKLHTRTK